MLEDKDPNTPHTQSLVGHSPIPTRREANSTTLLSPGKAPPPQLPPSSPTSEATCLVGGGGGTCGKTPAATNTNEVQASTNTTTASTTALCPDSSVHTPILPKTPTPKKAPLKQPKITPFLTPQTNEPTASHHTTRSEAAEPGLAGCVHPKFTATITKFKTEMVKIAPSEPLAKALAQAQGGERDSTGEEGLRGGVQPPPSPTSATSNLTQLEPPPTPSQQQESTWCPTHTTDIALGFTKAGDTLPLTHIQTVVTSTSKHQITPTTQNLPHAKAQGPTPSLSMVGGQEEERGKEFSSVQSSSDQLEVEHLPLSTPDLLISEKEKLKECKREKVDLTASQLRGTHMLRRSKLSRKSKNRACLVQGSCVTCTEVGVGDSLSERRSCVDGIHPPHRTAEENISRRVNQVVEICPPAKNPLPLMKAKEDTMPDGVRMIGANKQAYMYAGVRPLRRS